MNLPMIAVEFNTHSVVSEGTEENQHYVDEPNNTVNYLDVSDKYRTFPIAAAEHTFFSRA